MLTSCVLPVTLCCVVAFSQPPQSREDFATAIQRVQKGMTKAEVAALVGPPDDVLQQSDPECMGILHGQFWCYGTSGRRTFPTLGAIRFKSDRVDAAPALGDVPFQATGIPETKLRALLTAVAASPRRDVDDYDPLALIRAVNALQPYGKEKALAVLSEYARVVGSWGEPAERIGLILRALFDLPEGADASHDASMRGGGQEPPLDKQAANRFPLALVDDVPLLLWRQIQFTSGPGLNGLHQIQYFREHGTIRSHALRPANDPSSLLTELMASPAWTQGTDGTWFADVQGEILRLLRSVCRLAPKYDEARELYHGDFDQQTWESILDVAVKRGIRWDEKQQAYTFRDGTALPPEAPLGDIVRTWVPNLAPLNAQVWLRRTTKRSVEVVLTTAAPEREGMEGARIRVLQVGQSRPLDEWVIGGSAAALGGSRTSSISVPVGTRLVIEATHKGKTSRSRAMKM